MAEKSVQALYSLFGTWPSRNRTSNKKLQLVINKMENFTQLPKYNGDKNRPGNVSHKQKEDYRQQMPWRSKEAYLDMACNKDQ
jgi:hypothetical protein